MIATVPRPALANLLAKASANSAGETALMTSVSWANWMSSQSSCFGSMPWAISTMSTGPAAVAASVTRTISLGSTKSAVITVTVDPGPRTRRSAAMRSILAASRATSSRSMGPRCTHRRQQCSAITEVAPMTTMRVFSVMSASHQTPRHAGAYARVAIGQKFTEARVGRLEHLARHARILGGIEPPARRAHDGIEPPEQVEHAGPILEVEGQRDARRHETQQAGRRAIAEGLEHGQDRAFARARDGVEHVGDRLLAGRGRNDTLILIEALRTVEPVPLPDAVERIEERLVMHDASSGVALVQGVVGLVERAQGQAIDQRDRRRERECLLPRASRRGASGSRVGAHEQATHVGAGGAVDPRDSVLPG